MRPLQNLDDIDTLGKIYRFVSKSKNFTKVCSFYDFLNKTLSVDTPLVREVCPSSSRPFIKVMINYDGKTYGELLDLFDVYAFDDEGEEHKYLMLQELAR